VIKVENKEKDAPIQSHEHNINNIVDKAENRAPNTVRLGAVGLIVGALKGGPLGGFIGATCCSFIGALLDEKKTKQ
jgi:hypothetical protein